MILNIFHKLPKKWFQKFIVLSSVHSLSHVQLFVTQWTAARQASLSITSFQSLLKLMSIQSVMMSNHLILCHPLLLLPSIFPNIRVFSSGHVWMWELDYKESWAPKNWCLWTVVLEKTLESPLDTRRSNQSILKEISPEYSLEELPLKLKLQYFGHLMRRVDLLEKTLMLGGIGGRRKVDNRGWDGWMASPTRWTWVWMNSGRWWWTGRPGVLQFMGSQRVRHDWVTELNWIDTLSLADCVNLECYEA